MSITNSVAICSMSPRSTNMPANRSLAGAYREIHLDRFGAVLGVSGAQNRRFTSFFDTPRSFFAQNVAKVYRARAICPGILPVFPDEVRKNRPSYGFSPQKRGWKAQRKVREPLGFVRGPSFEALAGVFASGGACILISVRRSYLPHAVTHMLKHNELRVRRCAFWNTFDDVIC